jgi:hypothetical protein
VALVDGIISRVAKVMDKVSATDKAVYKRTVARSGGDTLTGRGVSVSNIDTLLSPQPVMAPAGAANPYVLAGSSLSAIGERYCEVSSLAMALLEVESKDTQLVLKNADASEAVYSISWCSSQSFQGKDIAFQLALVSRKR